MKPITIIGIGMSPADLTDRHRKRIQNAEILVGGRRLLEYFPDAQAEKIVITKDLKTLSRQIEAAAQQKSVVVLASGDPLFFGIGQRLVNSLGPENVVIYPNISTIGAAFSRIKESWNDAEVVSLHGRKDAFGIITGLERSEKVAVYTDPDRDPKWIARYLMEKQLSNVDMCVLERLGTHQERIRWAALDQVPSMEIVQPNIVILKRKPLPPAKAREPFIGMPEDWYQHQRGLITKSEVRAVAISKLRLKRNHTLWDLGAGSGSVSIEASTILQDGRVYAVEKRSDRVRHIHENKKRFNVANLEVIQVDLPDHIEGLPDPDRVFIGGGGEKLLLLLKAAANRLRPGGIIVINTVLLSNVDRVLETLKQLKFITGIVQLQISRGKAMPWSERLQAENPVWVISGEKI